MGDDAQNPQGELANQPILEGDAVYDVNGDKVCEVNVRGVEAGRLIVRKGLFFPTDLYIPLGAIRSRDTEEIHLSVSNDDIRSRHWDQPPIEEAALPDVRLATPIQPTAGAPVGLSGDAPQQDACGAREGADAPATADAFTIPATPP